MIQLKYIFLFLFLLRVSNFLIADIINVPTDQPTIQAGINASTNSDTVLVQPGIYLENINFNGKLITVASKYITTGDTSYISQTIIDGDSIGSVVTFDSNEDSTTVLCGFTIKNGFGEGFPYYFGGGITCKNSSNPNLENVTISGNIADRGGGIACVYWSSPTLENITITGNSAGYGGGIYCEHSDASLENVTITGNSAISSGGGIFCNHSSPILENVTITGNSAVSGGGICIGGYYPNFSNVLITNNSAKTGGGIYCDNSSPTFSNVTVSNNTAFEECGGIYSFFSNLTFSNNARCNIFNNNVTSQGYCNDIFSTEEITVIVDTFTVLYPNEYYASPIENFTFDILNGYHEQVDSDLYVSPIGNNNNSGLNPDEPLKNINYAFSKVLVDSLHPHTIYLTGGIYSPSSNGELFPLFIIDYLSIIGEAEDEVILDAENTSNVMRFSYIDSVIISNLTIMGGNTHSSNGGGINCFRSSPILYNITVTENNAKRGGGIYCLISSPKLISVNIKRNNAFYKGGGIFCCSPANIIFSSENRCNIYQNTVSGKECGNDIYSYACLTVIVDTFTVLNPTEFHTSPIENFTFDILNGYHEQVNSDLYVSPNGNNNNSGLNPEEPLKTINYAMSIIYVDSLHPHTIYLKEGIYSPSSNGELFPLYIIDYLSIIGETEGEVILNAESTSGVIKFDNVNDSYLSNLTITGGYSGYGAGVSFIDSSPNLNNITIVDNSSISGNAYGGGIYCSESSPCFENIIISNNTATTGDSFTGWAYGGGIYCDDSNPILQNVIISNNNVINTTSAYGGGIYCGYSSLTLKNVTITNNSVTGNKSVQGGGIYNNHSTLNIVNCILWNDSPQEISLCFPNSVTVSYSNIEEGWTGTGNIDADPLFIDPDNDDYHFLSSSPCIDAGTPDTTCLNLPPWDLDGNIRIWDGNGDSLAIIDMGCYEFGAPSYGINDNPENQIGFKLFQNYPNPFSNSTNISFNKPTNIREKIQIKIYNIKGQLIKQFKIKNAKTKMNIVSWNGKDENGNSLSNGIYLYRLETDNYKSKIKKMLLIR